MKYTEQQHEQLSAALAGAAIAHRDQTDKSGTPFIFHILRVAEAQKDNPDAAIVAALHDIIEDTDVTDLDEISEEFSPVIADAVDALTRRPHEKYSDYITRLSHNPLAVRVKKSDLLDNMDPDRQEFEGAASLFERHLEAYKFLTGIGGQAETKEAA